MKKILGFMFWILIAVLMVDAFGAFMWKVSGQTPQDGFYIGAITNGIFNSF